MTLSCFVQVLFNLANQYGNNDMYTEALNTYQVIVKNKMFNNAVSEFQMCFISDSLLIDISVFLISGFV